MYVKLIGSPNEEDLMWMKECTVGTMGKKVKTPPTSEWMRSILIARHSPIRELVFRYEMEIPYWVSNHIVRHHVGFQPYVQSQRNDRQDKYDRNSARQDEPVTVRVSINAEALMTLANKRLCMMAAKETRQVVQLMCAQAEAVMPELKGLLVPMCEYHGFICDEPHGCGKCMSRESVIETAKHFDGVENDAEN